MSDSLDVVETIYLDGLKGRERERKEFAAAAAAAATVSPVGLFSSRGNDHCPRLLCANRISPCG